MMDGSLFPDLAPASQPNCGSLPPMIVDSFAGGGGASTGIELALGRSPDVAVNHDARALAMHQVNHPETLHLNSNVWHVDPSEVCRGRRVGLAWFSPDCKHHSKAKGGKPVKKNIRDLAWVVVLWARRVRPAIVILENVEEFADWGPLTEENKPCPDRRGQTFQEWLQQLRRLGYKVEWCELRACDYGAPTIRKRLFLIARCDGKRIIWPKPTHGDPASEDVRAGQLKPWRTAAEIIDWSLPCPSIFDTSEQIMAQHGLRAVRPLKDATLRRIARGVMRYVIEEKEPFLVTYGQQGGGKHALVSAFLAQHNTGAIGRSADAPLSTLTTRATQQQAVAVHLMNMHGSTRRSGSVSAPHPTITAGGQHSVLVAAFLQKYYGQGIGQALDTPAHTARTRDAFGLVQVEIDGSTYAIADIGMRMLTPREQFRAQGFPESYRIDTAPDGSAFTKTEQTRMCGNSVCPPIAEAIVRANCSHLAATHERIAS